MSDQPDPRLTALVNAIRAAGFDASEGAPLQHFGPCQFWRDVSRCNCPIKEVVAALAVEASPRAAEWQPIETAPKDDRRVLVALKPRPLKTVGEITFGYWAPEADVWTRDETGEAIEPTHWMPVPAPPRAEPT
jgi:hypothetical protein